MMRNLGRIFKNAVKSSQRETVTNLTLIAAFIVAVGVGIWLGPEMVIEFIDQLTSEGGPDAE